MTHVISADYLLLGNGGEGDAGGGTVIVLKCHATKVVTAVPLPSKGATDVNVHVVADAVVSFGQSHVAFRNDGEPSLKALMSKVADEMRRREIGVMQLTEEQTVAYDSNSAGAAESAGKTVQGIARSLLSSVQEKAGGTVPARSHFLTWLLRHAGWCHSSSQIGVDGRTPFQRQRGGDAHDLRLPHIGETVLAKIRTRGKMSARWKETVFLGVKENSMEKVVADEESVFYTRSLRRLPPLQAFSLDLISSVVHPSWSPHAKVSLEADVIPHDFVSPPPPPAAIVPVVERSVAIKRMMIRRADLQRFGYTQGC